MADIVRSGPAATVQAKRSSSSYVGNYIYEPRGTSPWHGHSKRQKTVRHAQTRNSKKRHSSGTSGEESVIAQSSESGYDTNGDASTPRKTRESDAGSLDLIAPARDSQAGVDGVEQKVGNPDHKESSSGMQKALRDLNRCDVSLQKYRHSLQQVSSPTSQSLTDEFHCAETSCAAMTFYSVSLTNILC